MKRYYIRLGVRLIANLAIFCLLTGALFGCTNETHPSGNDPQGGDSNPTQYFDSSVDDTQLQSPVHTPVSEPPPALSGTYQYVLYHLQIFDDNTLTMSGASLQEPIEGTYEFINDGTLRISRLDENLKKVMFVLAITTENKYRTNPLKYDIMEAWSTLI